MHTFPHKPALSTVPEMQRRTLQVFDSPGLLEAAQLDPRWKAVLAEQRLISAMLAYAAGESISATGDAFTKALEDVAGALEAGWRPHPWDVWTYTLLGLAVGDRGTALFWASMPEESWMDVRNYGLHWLMMQIKVLFALTCAHEADAARWVDASRVAAFDESPTEGMKLDLDEIRNFHQLLEALHRNDPVAFNAALKVRTEVRAASFTRNGRNSPLGFLDLHGLGLCALARDRGIHVTVRHVYLPLDLLDAGVAGGDSRGVGRR